MIVLADERAQQGLELLAGVGGAVVHRGRLFLLCWQLKLPGDSSCGNGTAMGKCICEALMLYGLLYLALTYNFY